MNCDFCQDTGWESTPRGAVRCRHTKQQQARETCTPLNDKALAGAIKALSAIAFFPTDAGAQTVIGDALASMCPSVESLRYVVRRAVSLYRSWDKCGVPGLRQIVCAKYRPADGSESGPTDEYPEGLPSETKHDPLALPSGATRLIEGSVTEDVDLDRKVRLLAQSKRMDRRKPNPEHEPMSEARRAQLQAQVDAALLVNRDKRAREEAGL